MITKTTTMPNTSSLRERKKARTRAELIAIAERLFRKQGYEETTLEQVAEVAEVSIRTVHRYFESKQQLAMAGFYDNLEAFRALVADRERKLDTLTYWRKHVEDSARGLASARDFASYVRFVFSVPTLAMGQLDVARMFEDTLAEGLAADAGVDPRTDLHGRLLAAMLVGGNSAAVRHWIESSRREDLSKKVLAVVDFAIKHFPARNTAVARKLRKA